MGQMSMSVEVPERQPRERPRRSPSNDRPPTREGFRLLVPGASDDPGVALRDAADGRPVMHGHFAVFNRWTEIDSFFEGTFMERIAPGAFRKTFKEQRDSMRVLFNHGQDPQFANKPLGPIDVLREDATGGSYEVPLLDTPMIRDELLPGLRANLYGASFRFKVMRESTNASPEPSDENPRGLDERTIKEAQVMEFGPVTFPAYPQATAGVRSITDDYFLEALAKGDADTLRMMAGEGSDLLGRFVEHRFGISVPALPKPEAELVDEPEPEVGAPVERVTVRQDTDGCPVDVPYAVLDGGALVACHRTRATADAHANMMTSKTSGPDEPERDDASADDAPPAPVKSATPVRKAAPGHSPTPLLGHKREPWRL